MGRFDKIANLQPANESTVEPAQEDIKIPSKISPKISSEISSPVVGELSPYTDSVRRAVRWPGKESSPLRITADELNKLKAVVRYFEDRGYATDRTQLIRVALNYMLDDFERRGDSSLFTEILDRINSY